MRSYIGSKIINAEVMTRVTFEHEYQSDRPHESKPDESGYHVVYGNREGEYHSWSPKDVFDEAYRPISAGEQLLVKNLLG